MMLRMNLAALCVAALTSAVGCQRGSVVRPVETRASTQYSEAPDVSAIGRDSVEASPDYVMPEDEPAPQDFVDAYEDAGRPRVCVFFKKTLSEETSEWSKHSRIDLSWYAEADVERSGTRDGEAFDDNIKGDITGQGSATNLSHRATGSGPTYFWDRVDEDRFLNYFHSAGVRFVDNRIALRKLAAARNMEDRLAKDTDDFRSLEMISLEGSVDILIEVLSAVAGGEEIYYAKAVRIGDNRIMATASTDRPVAPPLNIPGTNSTVMEPVSDPVDPLKFLSHLLMNRMAGSLGEDD